MPEQRDPLWPNGGRPACANDDRPVYLQGLCSECWAAKSRAEKPGLGTHRADAGPSRIIRVDPEVYAELERLRRPGESMQAGASRVIRERLEGRGGRPVQPA